MRPSVAWLGPAGGNRNPAGALGERRIREARRGIRAGVLRIREVRNRILEGVLRNPEAEHRIRVDTHNRGAVPRNRVAEERRKANIHRAEYRRIREASAGRRNREAGRNSERPEPEVVLGREPGE